MSRADLEILDRYVEREGLASRSAGVRTAIRRLHRKDLREAYALAWREWDDSGTASDWESTVADGLGGDDGGRPCCAVRSAWWTSSPSSAVRRTNAGRP